MQSKGCTLILGMFDGVHIGHRALIAAARKTNRPVVAYTFNNHPQAAVKGIAPPMLMTSEEKRDKLLELGVDRVVMETFDAKMAGTPEHEYIERLYLRFMPSAIIVGYNHTFGAGGKGTPETIRAMASGRYEAVTVAPVVLGGQPVSSTRIRERLAAGDLAQAAELLGEPYCLEGIVQHDTGIGTHIGFPTANIPVPRYKLLPPNGVYAVRARLENRILPGVMNIGVKPTVTEANRITLETHMIGFGGDAYGKRLKLELLRFIRKERRFESKEALAAQIEFDSTAALELFEK